MRFLWLFLCWLALPLDAETRVPSTLSEVQLSFAPLVRQAAPAVVNIYARRVVAQRQNPFGADPFFRDFFSDFGQLKPRVQNSLGSGVILSADGIVVSNYHVVGQATDIRVVLQDRREFAAQVLLADEESDLAILQLQGAGDMPFLPLRSSDTVEVGELVLAIGNPFGVGQTVSSGIVSGLARSGAVTGNARGYFIQTDAPINPGNSGGPLINMDGHVVGINTSIFSRSGGNIGIGFAIPIDLARDLIPQLKADGKVTRGWMGVMIQKVTPEIAESLGLEEAKGALVADVVDDGPAEKAGIQVGDVIMTFAGNEVESSNDLPTLVAREPIGDEVPVVVWRDGEEATLELKIAQMEEDDSVLSDDMADEFGLSAQNLTPEISESLGMDPETKGVIVSGV